MTFYFISTFFLIVGGFISFLPLLVKTNQVLKNWIFQVKFQLRWAVYGVLSTILFIFFPVDGTLFFGDLLPFIASIVLSVLFALGYIRQTKYLQENQIRQADKILTAIQIPAGIMAFLVGLLHIIFPAWMFF
ncbi:MAG: hypothetical protein CVV50_01090 [Spirochaetae bacterium HGW-Spirochaetae-6]|nr:MAG: hypothetical protein CVV50_01090 [Spirochaetae bacterium HGW-Spirochaetae-6]